MFSKEKVSFHQFKKLVFLFTIGTSVLFIPSSLAAAAKQDAWLGAIAGVALSLFFVFIYCKLWGMFPQMSFVGISQKVLGKYAGGFISLIFSFYSFIGCTTVLFYVGNFLTTQIMPETPIQFINALFAIIVVIGVRMGIEVLARTAEILLPWVIFLFIFIILTISPQLEPDHIQPFFESGIKPILSNAITYAATASLPFISFFMIFPNVNQPHLARKGFYSSTLFGGMFLAVLTLFTILVLGVEMTVQSTFSSYRLVQKINVGDFLTRIEAILAGMWFITVYFKTTLYFYGWVTSFSELLKFKDYRPMCFPFGIIMVIFSTVVYPNSAYMQTWDTEIFIPYIMTVGFMIPILLLGIALISKKGLSKRK